MCAWNHYKNSGFRHSTEKHFLVREVQKVGFLSENLALCRSTQRPLANVSFFLRLRVTSRNPYFCSVFGTSQSGIVEKCTFLKTSKNQGQKKKCIIDIFALVFWGPETPIFIVFSRPQKSGVQLSSLEVTKMGFNYAPVSMHIYIYTHIHIYIYIHIYIKALGPKRAQKMHNRFIRCPIWYDVALCWIFLMNFITVLSLPLDCGRGWVCGRL